MPLRREELLARYWPGTKRTRSSSDLPRLPAFPNCLVPAGGEQHCTRRQKVTPIKSEAVRKELLRNSVCLERGSQVGVIKRRCRFTALLT
jgi:hypothetical protein